MEKEIRKQLWSEPQITEIAVKMTEASNKVGFKADAYSADTDLIGDLCPPGTCS